MSDQRYMLGFEKLLQHTTEKQVFNEKIGEYIADFKVESLKSHVRAVIRELLLLDDFR